MFSFTFPVRQMGQAVFSDLSVCTEPASPCLSATCVSLYSLCPVGLGRLICQAVCWPPQVLTPLGSNPCGPRMTDLSSNSSRRLFCTLLRPLVTRAVSQLSQYVWWMLHILSVVCLFFGSPFYCLDFSLLSLANSVSESLISFWLTELACRVMICLRHSC